MSILPFLSILLSQNIETADFGIFEFNTNLIWYLQCWLLVGGWELIGPRRPFTRSDIRAEQAFCKTVFCHFKLLLLATSSKYLIVKLFHQCQQPHLWMRAEFDTATQAMHYPCLAILLLRLKIGKPAVQGFHPCILVNPLHSASYDLSMPCTA